MLLDRQPSLHREGKGLKSGGNGTTTHISFSTELLIALANYTP